MSEHRDSEPLDNRQDFTDRSNNNFLNEAQRQIFELEHELQYTRENLQEFTTSNIELHKLNLRYQSKIQELTQLNNDVDNLLKSTGIGVIFLDEELKIRKFTPAASVAVSLHHTDIGRQLPELPLNIECPELPIMLRQVQSERQSIELEVKLKENNSYFLMGIHPYQTEDKHRQNQEIVISFVKINETQGCQLQLENTLQELETRKGEITRFFHLSLDMLCIANFNGYFDQINHSFSRILGYSSKELLDRPFIDLVHPDDVEATLQEVKKLAEGQDTIGFENRYRCKNGSYRWFKWMATSHHGKIYATAQDFTEQKLARELQQRQFVALETAGDGIAILNEDKFIYLNQAHLEIFGYSKPEDLVGKSWRVLFEPEELTRLEREVFPLLLKQGRWQGETRAKHRDGHTFDEELTLTFTSTGDLICVCRDISEIKQARQQLVKTNVELEQRVMERTQTLADFSDRLKQLHRLATTNYEQLEDLFDDYIETGCQMFNLATGIVSKVTNNTYKIFAVRSPLNLSVGFEVDCQDTYCAEVIKKQTTVSFYHVGAMENMKGHPVYQNLRLESFISTPIFVNGDIYGTLNFSDTVPRKREFESHEREIIELMAKDIGNSIAALQINAALQKSERRFRSTFEQAAVGVAHVSPQGKFIRVNQRLCNIVGYSNEDLIKLTFQEITHPDDLTADLEYVKQMLAGEISTYSMEKRYIHCNGSIVWINLTVSLVKNNLGKPDYFITVIEDISDRKQTEIALEESRTKLQQANRAKDAFIANMSHELRTPLNSILGFSSLLQKDSHLLSEQLRSINIIHQSGQHLLTLINDILDLSKITAKKLHLESREFNLIHFLHNITDIFQLRAREKELSLSAQISSSLPTVVKADETRLRQILLNLLSNAIKFTSTGSVTLSVNCLPEISSSVTKTIRFQVEDTGCGIPRDKYDDIFSPFGQVKQSGDDSEGTGLGLTICQHIVELMDSKLHLESQVGRGTRFWFELKLEEVSPNSLQTLVKSESASQPLGTLRKPCKVLIVDDCQENRILLVQYLQKLGFTLKEADNGRVGLAIAEEFQPDVILVDLMMPVMDGREMSERVRQHSQLQDTFLLMISANIQSILNSSAIKCDGFLAKPVDLEELLALLQQHLQLEWQIDGTTDNTVLRKVVGWKKQGKQGSKGRINSAYPNSIGITETNLVKAFDTPTEAELVKLLELVNFGNMEALLEQIDLLEAADSQYISFVREVRQLAKNCQQDKLERLFISLIK